jgi:hypothetical protein
VARNRSERDDEDDDVAPAGPPADASVGLAAIAVVFAVVAAVLFYLDTDALGGVKTTGPTVQVTASVPAAAATK